MAAACSGVREITAEDRADVEEYPFQEDADRKQMGAFSAVGEEGFSTLERRSDFNDMPQGCWPARGYHDSKPFNSSAPRFIGHWSVLACLGETRRTALIMTEG